MGTVVLKRVSARYHLAPGAGALREHLDRVFRRASLDALAAALDRMGISTDDLLCIERVDANLAIKLGDSEQAWATIWTDSVAAAIRRALDAGGSGVVRFRSRRQALVDLVLGAARNDMSRAWAWRQLGLWLAPPSADPRIAVTEALRVLAREPLAVVPVLAHVAAAGLLSSFVQRAASGVWSELARVALRASGASAGLAAPLTRVRNALAAARITASPWLAPTAVRSLTESAIARAITAEPRTAALPPGLRRTLAVLTCLETTPERLRDEEDAEVLVAFVEERLGGPQRETTLESADPKLLAAGRSAPAPSAILERESLARAVSATEPGGDNAAPRAAATARRGLEASPSALAETPPALTAAGGLLFLLHLVRALELPAQIQSDKRLAYRSLKAVLHQLALALVHMDERDPAALAFCGLAPDADPPGGETSPFADEERAALWELRAALLLALRRSFADDERSDEQLLSWLVGRRAAVVADPGWIEIHFSFDDVSLELRRAGLDLHPDWLPWLGAVVRFVYV